MTSEPVGNSPRGGIPNNSHKERDAVQAQAQHEAAKNEPLEAVAHGRKLKKAWYKRAAGSILADDTSTIGEYILIDVLVPAIKNLLYDIVTQGTGRALYSGGRANMRGPSFGLRGSQSSIRTKYDQMSSGPGPMMTDPRPSLSREARARHDFSDVVLDSREEAISILDNLISQISQYGVATVRNLYELCGITSNDYMDQKWGWRNLDQADVRQYRGGWLLDLPAPVPFRD